MNGIFASYSDQLNDLLQRICHNLQLSSAQHAEAKKCYTGVADWLAAPGSPFEAVDSQIYPQGSLQIGTTVRPNGRQEFDLDIVCQVDEPVTVQPVELLDGLEKRLRANGNYSPLVERKNRCIRLQYAKQFHMDILPCVTDPVQGNGCVLAPDCKTGGWSPSNPKGFAAWFEGKAWTPQLTAMNEAVMAKVEVEPMPDAEPVGIKPPLKLAVQLLKRNRDIYFEKKPERAPISVVLTTLAGELYDGSLDTATTLDNLVTAALGKAATSGGMPFKVENPTNKKENFAERWEEDPSLFHDFQTWARDFQRTWAQIRTAKSLPETLALLKQAFGEPAETAFTEQAEVVRKAQGRGALGTVLGGGLEIASQTVHPSPRHSFHLDRTK
ncbi:SMODS domain-containing nucleotidyltransferase [Humidesulfovibrio sp.]